MTHNDRTGSDRKGHMNSAKKQALCPVISNVEVMPGVYLMWIEAPDVAGSAWPGQFITVRCGDYTLRRPFSVHQVSSREFAILFRVTGEGTLWLSQRQKADRIDILGPLGNGFRVDPSAGNLLMVGGGIGIAPLAFLLQYASSRHRITFVHGATTAAQLYVEHSQPPAVNYEGVRFISVTEDGSMGRKGMVTDILPDFLDAADQTYACGPVNMYKTMALTLNSSPLKREDKGEGEKQSIPKLRKCQVSLEVRMGCGFGACYGCTINTRKGLKRVCRDGSIFELGDIIWQEVRI
jgi:dihydroorotate dehydrogenase electron transfer subunit